MAKICSSRGETNTYIILLPHSEINHNFQIQNFFFFDPCSAVATEIRDLESLPSRSHEVPYVLPVSRTNKPDSSVTGQIASRKKWLSVRVFSSLEQMLGCPVFHSFHAVSREALSRIGYNLRSDTAIFFVLKLRRGQKAE